MSATELLMLSLLGAIFGLDVVSFPQAMISRPIVAATIGGAAVGRTSAGFVAGIVLELIALDTLPVGASRYPEWGSASLVGGALAGIYGGAPYGGLALAVIAAMLTAWFGGWTMFLVRRLNGAWARRRLPALDAGEPRAVIGLQLVGMTTDFGRAFLLTGIALLLLVPFIRALLEHWGAHEPWGRALVVGCAVAVAGSAVWKVVHGTAQARWYGLAGLVVGLGLVLLR